jgi:hypothetical protein
MSVNWTVSEFMYFLRKQEVLTVDVRPGDIIATDFGPIGVVRVERKSGSEHITFYDAYDNGHGMLANGKTTILDRCAVKAEEVKSERSEVEEPQEPDDPIARARAKHERRRLGKVQEPTAPIYAPDQLAGLASSASTCLDLVSKGIYDDSVDHGLAEGENLCDFIVLGGEAALSERFSVRSLAAQRAVSFVKMAGDGPEFIEDARSLRDEMASGRARLQRGETWTDGAVTRLREMFFRLTVQLMNVGGPRVGR